MKYDKLRENVRRLRIKLQRAKERESEQTIARIEREYRQTQTLLQTHIDKRKQ